MFICGQNNYQEFQAVHSQITNDSATDGLDKDDEKLLKEILEIASFSYKNIIDIAALYFCGLSVDKNKLYEQIVIQLSKDIFTVIRLFAWYIPVMLKNPKLKMKEKLKKSSYVVGTTIVFWCLCAEILQKKICNNSLGIARSLNLKQYDTPTVFNVADDISESVFEPRNRPR